VIYKVDVEDRGTKFYKIGRKNALKLLSLPNEQRIGFFYDVASAVKVHDVNECELRLAADSSDEEWKEIDKEWKAELGVE